MKAYIGGLNAGKRIVKRTAERISARTGEEVLPFTYSWTGRNEAAFKDALETCDSAVTHSLGMMAVVGSGVALDRLDAVAPPIPVSRARLFGQAVLKTLDMITRPRSGYRSMKETYIYLGSSLAEMLIHPISNFKAFARGSVSAFNAMEYAQYAEHTQLLYGTNDEFFARRDTPLVGEHVTLVEGARHDDVVVSDAFDQYLDRRLVHA